MLLVIDTNVLLSGLLWRGSPHALLDKVREGAADLALSPALIEELADVLARPKFAAILARTSRTPARILAELRTLGGPVLASTYLPGSGRRRCIGLRLCRPGRFNRVRRR